MTGRLVLSAFGVHTGGGRVLLEALIDAAAPRITRAELDARFVPWARARLPEHRIHAVAPNLVERLQSLRRSPRHAAPGDVWLGFNGLPPLADGPGRVVLFVQSALFTRLAEGLRYPPRARLRHWLERRVFAAGRHRVERALVQTPTMAAALAERWPGLKVGVAPFLAEGVPVPPGSAPPRSALPGSAPPGSVPPGSAPPEPETPGPPEPPGPPGPPGLPLRLFYPADGAAHKNHDRLLKAMALLAREGLPVRLELTLPPHEVAARLAALGLPVDLATGTGPIGREAVLARIAEADALIFPSLTESFGLPLLEARAAGTAIIAAERDFVRDVCTPAESFDPLSARSIADAVRRFAGRPRPLARPTDAAGFVEALFA